MTDAKSKLEAGAKGVAKAGRKTVAGVKANATDLRGPSPNPHTNLVIADIALRGGAMLARRGVERTFLGAKYAPRKAAAILKGRTMGETLLHTAIAKVATRSVPGAIAVGGALLAKTIYDRHKGRAAAIEGEKDLHEMAQDGEQS